MFRLFSVVLFVMFFQLISLAQAENGGGRRYMRGGYDDPSPRFSSGQRYSTESAYDFQHQSRYSQFGNGHDLSRKYYANSASGQFSERGYGSRGYQHNGDPQRVGEMNRREAHINRFHEGYVDQMHKTMETKAETEIFKEKIGSNTRTSERTRQQIFSDQAEADALLQRTEALYRRLHSDVTSGRR